MKMYLERAIFINRAPFDYLDLTFKKNDISVLSGINGKGKTTILSHIVDAFYEMARKSFPQEFEGKETKFYRISSNIFAIELNLPSITYIRFKYKDKNIDFIDIRYDYGKDIDAAQKVEEEAYNKVIIEDKLKYSTIFREKNKNNFIKKIHISNEIKIENLFFGNILTYFPSYRYEQPGYLNDPYKISLEFSKRDFFSGYLKNPIEITTDLNEISNWLMDVVLDFCNVKGFAANIEEFSDNIFKEEKSVTFEKPFFKQLISGIVNFPNALRINEMYLLKNLNEILNNILSSKYSKRVRFGVGERNYGGIRIHVTEEESNNVIYPSIFNMSSGELAILCLFGEILRQADTLNANILLEQVKGIVLVDEADKHLHIKLQKEVLPKLLNLFPNIQFIISSHSPFLCMGLAEVCSERTKIIDLDNEGIITEPTKNQQYIEVYNMMIKENENILKEYNNLQEEIKESTAPIIIPEGKTDTMHLEKALKELNIDDLEINFYQHSESDGGSIVTKTLLENLAKIPQSNKIIGIFDRDEREIINDIEINHQSFKDYGNNVYAFCIPKPPGRENYNNISIEFYYSDSEIKKEHNGSRLYFTNEIEELYNKTKKCTQIKKQENPDIENENNKKIFCHDIGDENGMHSKSVFADLVLNESGFSEGFNFENFRLIFDKIKEIISPD